MEITFLSAMWKKIERLKTKKEGLVESQSQRQKVGGRGGPNQGVIFI